MEAYKRSQFNKYLQWRVSDFLEFLEPLDSLEIAETFLCSVVAKNRMIKEGIPIDSYMTHYETVAQQRFYKAIREADLYKTQLKKEGATTLARTAPIWAYTLHGLRYPLIRNEASQLWSKLLKSRSHLEKALSDICAGDIVGEYEKAYDQIKNNQLPAELFKNQQDAKRVNVILPKSLPNT